MATTMNEPMAEPKTTTEKTSCINTTPHRTSWPTARAAMTTAVVTMGVLLHGASLVAPQWATGETYHLASSSAFQVDLTAGLWGYCRTATPSSTGVEEDCYSFHSTLGDHQLSVCEAFARGFVYGTDDIRGIRLPVEESNDVHRIERPPTSLDDVHIQKFIAKSCGGDGITTLSLALLSLMVAASTLVASAWALMRKQDRESSSNHTNTVAMQANSALLQFSALAALATVAVWLHQSWDLRQTEDTTRDRVSISLGYAVYVQLVVALLYFAGSMGMLSTLGQRGHCNQSSMKI